MFSCSYSRMKQYKKQKHFQTWNSLKRSLKTYILVENNNHLPHWPRSWGKSGTCPVITPAMDDCEGVKRGHVISHEWCLFPQNQFWCFKVECLVDLTVYKKSRNDKASWEY